MGIKTLTQLNPQNAKVILRCDLNVPIKDGVIGDPGRIIASLSTIKKLLAANCSIVVIAHLGRPKGIVKPELSLAPIAKKLGETSQIELQIQNLINESSVAKNQKDEKRKEKMMILRSK